MTSYKIEGGVQLAKIFRGLSEAEGKAAARKMLREAAEPIREEAERLVPISDEAPHIVDHIVVSSVTKVNDDELGDRALTSDEHVVAIGPSKDFFYGFFVEFGFGKGARTPKPFMRPAFDTRWQASMKVLQDGIWSFLRSRSNTSTTGRGL